MILKKKHLQAGFQPNLIVMGRHYFQMPVLQPDPNEPTPASTSYLLDPQMQLHVEHNTMYLPDSCTDREKTEIDAILQLLKND